MDAACACASAATVFSSSNRVYKLSARARLVSSGSTSSRRFFLLLAIVVLGELTLLDELSGLRGFPVSAVRTGRLPFGVSSPPCLALAPSIRGRLLGVSAPGITCAAASHRRRRRRRPDDSELSRVGASASSRVDPMRPATRSSEFPARTFASLLQVLERSNLHPPLPLASASRPLRAVHGGTADGILVSIYRNLEEHTIPRATVDLS